LKHRYSALNMKRPALQRLLADVQAGKIDCVVVNSLDRVTRLSEHAEPLKAIFQQHGLAVETPDGDGFNLWADSPLSLLLRPTN
jgi:DNA invertase Pin-like site-specific DNA recombinase